MIGRFLTRPTPEAPPAAYRLSRPQTFPSMRGRPIFPVPASTVPVPLELIGRHQTPGPRPRPAVLHKPHLQFDNALNKYVLTGQPPKATEHVNPQAARQHGQLSERVPHVDSPGARR